MPCPWPNCSCLPDEQCPELPDLGNTGVTSDPCPGCDLGLPVDVGGLHHDYQQPVMRCLGG